VQAEVAVEELKVALIKTGPKVLELIKVNPEITQILVEEKTMEIPKCKLYNYLKVNS
jgi:hypothetical protein